MTPADLRERIALARNNRHRTELVDPYVHALAELSILAEAMLVAGDRYIAGDADPFEVRTAEDALRAVLPLAPADVRPDWKDRLLVDLRTVSPRPSWWRRMWRRRPW